MNTKKQKRRMPRAFGRASLSAVLLVAGTALAQGATSSRVICATLGGASQWEAVGDRTGHNIQVTHGNCRVEGGALDGGIVANNGIWEFDGATGTLLSGDGVVRKSGALAAYRITTGNIALNMKDGVPAGWTASGKGVFTLAAGSAAALAGKTYSWSARPTGPGQSVQEWVMD